MFSWVAFRFKISHIYLLKRAEKWLKTAKITKISITFDWKILFMSSPHCWARFLALLKWILVLVIHMLPFEMAMVAKMVKIGHFEAFWAKMAIIAMTIGDMCMTMIYIYFSSIKNLAQQWRNHINRTFQSKVIEIFVILAVLSHFLARFRR